MATSECQICANSIDIEPVVRTKTEEEVTLKEFTPDYDHTRRLFPSELDLINLTYFEYSLENLKKSDTCVHIFEERMKKDAEFLRCCKYMTDNGWILLETFAHLNNNLLRYICDQGQFGAAFFNTTSKQLVIVHRGTSFKNWTSVEADWKEVVNRIVGDFGCRAYLYTKSVIERYGLGAESVTVTGHSLGGWLAQVSAFYMQHPEFLDKLVVRPTALSEGAIRQIVTLKDTAKLLGLRLKHVANSSYKHVHCVSFDGPGCKEAIEIMLPGRQKYGEDRRVEQLWILDSLDINVYFSELDIVNIVNEQIGSVFYMEMSGQTQTEAEQNQAGCSRSRRIVSGLLSLGKDVLLAAPGVSSAVDWYKLFVGPHSCLKILNFWIQYDKQVQNPQDDILARVLKVTDWPVKRGFTENAAASHHNAHVRNLGDVELDKKRDFKRFRMSCFNRDERKNIETALACKEFYQKDKAVWEKATHFSIKFLASDAGGDFRFNLQIFYQIIQLNEQCVDSELFRDFFIRKMKFHVREFKALDIKKMFPSYMEAVYVSRTAEYLKTLPELSNSESGFLEFILTEFDRDETCIISVRAAKADSRICTAKIFQLVQQQRPDLKLPKQYVVVSTFHLARMEDILANQSAPFLPDLKYVVVECISEHELELVNDWIAKLCVGSVARKIVVVFPMASKNEVSRAEHKHKVSQQDERFLREGLDILSLMETQVEFKLQGDFHNLSEFFSGTVTESSQPPESETSAKEKMLDLVPEKIRASLPQEIYPMLEKGSLGTLLPQLDNFEEAYFLSRTYQEIAIKSYTKAEDVFIVCVDSIDLATRSHDYLGTFIRQQHKGKNAIKVLCEEVFDKLFDPETNDKDWTLFEESCKNYKFVKVVCDGQKVNQKLVWVMQKILEKLGLNGHIVQLKDYVSPDPKTDSDRFKLVWLSSFGKLEMSSLTVQEIGTYNYEKLAEGRQRLTVIADEPGMGKTIAMQKLAIMSQRACKDAGTNSSPHYTIFMELGNVAQILRKELSREVSLTNIVKALAEIESVEEKQIIGAILTYMLKQEGKVRIFLDGLDEIDDELRAIVLEMVDILLLESEARIHIATRDRLSNELQRRFKTPCLKLIKLTNSECEEFLSNYWQKHAEFKPLQFMKADVVHAYIQAFLECFEAKLGSEAKKFIGIPFQLRLLAAAYMRDPFFKFYDMYAISEQPPKINVLRELKLLPEFTDLAGLYKLFIDTKIREAFKEKYGLDLESQKEFLKEKAYDEEMLRIHRIAGFDKIFCVNQRKQISNEEVRPTPGQTEALHVCGIVSHYKPNSTNKGKSDDTEFVHQTLAEYFAAEFIFSRVHPKIAEKNKKEVQHFLDSYLFLSRYENVLNFLNMLILESAPQLLKWATDPHANAYDILNVFNGGAHGEEHHRHVDCLGRNFIHYVIIYSKSWLDKSCQVCRSNKKSYFLLLDGNLLEKKDIFNATPFAYIFANRDFVYLGMDGTTIAFVSLLLNMNVHWRLESSAEMSHGYSSHDVNDSWDRKQKAREKADGFLHKYREPGYQLDIYDWHEFTELDSLSGSCSCNTPPQFSEPNVQDIVQITNDNAAHLTDLQIELRRNSSSLAYCLHEVHRPDKKMMQFALGLEEESRVVFLCELEGHIKLDDKKSFQTDLVELLKENEYEHYKSAAGSLHVDRANGLLEMFRGEMEAEQIEEGLKRGIFSAWAATDFLSLRKELQGVFCHTGHFERFCMFTPKSKGSPTGKNSGGKKLLQIIEEWLKTTKPGYHDREQKIVCMLPMLWLVLDTQDFTEFVQNHESDILAIFEESITSIVDIQFYKTLATKLCECLDDAGDWTYFIG